MDASLGFTGMVREASGRLSLKWRDVCISERSFCRHCSRFRKQGKGEHRETCKLLSVLEKKEFKRERYADVGSKRKVLMKREESSLVPGFWLEHLSRR